MRIYYTLNGSRHHLDGDESFAYMMGSLPDGAQDIHWCNDGMLDDPLSEMLNADIKDAVLDFMYDNFLDEAIEGWAEANGYDVQEVTARYSDQAFGVNDIDAETGLGHCISCAHFGKETELDGICNNNQNARCKVSDSCLHYLENEE